MANFYIYGDESGKLEQSDYVSFCGYVGHAREFERAMVEWDTVRFTWGVPPIHMRCVMDPDRSRCGEWLAIKHSWGQLWEKKRDAMLNNFGMLVGNSNIACIGGVVDSAHFRTMPESQWKNNMQNPIFLAFYSMILDGFEKTNVISEALPVGIVVDDEEKYAKSMYDLLLALKAQFPQIKERVTAITFGDDRQYPALQMADMIAFEARTLMVQRLKDPLAEPSKLYSYLTKSGHHQPRLWTAESLDIASQM